MKIELVTEVDSDEIGYRLLDNMNPKQLVDFIFDTLDKDFKINDC